MTTAPTPTPEARFLYDDCCPLCKGYTAVFTGLGWADRAGFSTIGDDTLADLDLDRARHFIPLHDPATRTVLYGMDGILTVVGARVPLLERVGRTRPVRAALEAFYSVVTYNRRHIVASAPPATGFDCAPDHHRLPVVTYVLGAIAVAVALAITANLIPLTVALLTLGVGLALGRSNTWRIEPEAALGHAATVTLAGTGAAAIAALLGAGPVVATVVGGVVGARKLWLRRWMLSAR